MQYQERDMPQLPELEGVMAIPEKVPQKLRAIHERLFGERNREVVDARARVLEASNITSRSRPDQSGVRP